MADSGVDDIKDTEVLATKRNLPLQRLLIQIPDKKDNAGSMIESNQSLLTCAYGLVAVPSL